MNTDNARIIYLTAQSGAGKGLTLTLLNPMLEAKNLKILNLGVGNLHRNMIDGGGYFSKRAREINDQGLKQPAAMPIWLCSQAINDLAPGHVLILIEGSPRSKKE